MLRIQALTFIALFLLLIAHAAATEALSDWPFCHQTNNRSLPSYVSHAPKLDNDQQRTHLHADQAESIQDKHYHLQGNVQIWRGNQWMEADEAFYQVETEETTLTGDIRLGNLNLSANGQGGIFNFARNQGEIKDAEYFLFEQHGRGDADIVTFESETFTKLKKARYTTCDEDSNDWYIHARYVTLNRETGIGTAAPVYITFYKVPILFSPYLSFPIDDRRKSGFLFPSFGRSSESGTEISAPYYLNLAPNYDATITPKFMSRRGIMLDTQFRYLFAKGEGEIQATYLDYDEVYNAERSLYSLNHRSRFNPHWHGLIDIKYASDEDYLDDFGDSLSTSTETHLQETAELNYIKGHTQASLLLQGYQTLDKTIPEASRPYRRLPQITFSHWAPIWDNRLSTDILGEYVYFDRTDRLTGHRIDLSPSIKLPYHRQAGFFEPKITLRHTEYQLNYEGKSNTDENLSRTLMRTSIDTGIFLERKLSLFDRKYKQTLEPRLFYTHTPYKDQSEIPVFDTGLSTFSHSFLFQEDRFSGADRVGDTEQVTVSITSRLFDSSNGHEIFKGSIGQIFYLQNRKVGLAGDSLDTSSQSDIVAEATTRLTRHLTGTVEGTWNHKTDEIDKGSARLTYDAGTKRYLRASYFWDRASVAEQTDLAISWPIHSRWQLIGRHLFAHRETRTIEAVAGLEYTSCCWSARLLHRRYQLTEEDNSNESIMLQLELKGLASIGNPIEDIIAESVLGQTLQ